MELDMSQKQAQSLSPQMIQSMEVLQMGTQELLEYIAQTVQENPVLDTEEKNDSQEEFDDLRRKMEWLESTDLQNKYYYQQDAEGDRDAVYNYGTVETQEETLRDYVLFQLQALDLTPEVMTCAILLVNSLNQSGWLDEDFYALASDLGQPMARMQQALAAVQSLEPAGVAARNLSECLCLQLARYTPINDFAVSIATEHLDALSKNQYGVIARALKTSPQEVAQACELIRSLNPRPGAGFAAYEKTTYISPDIIVVNVFDHFELVPNDYRLPRLNINSYYTQLLKDSNEKDVKDYLMNKVNQAKWLMRAVEQRSRTLTACAQCILELQEEFFQKGPGHLVPLSLADVAERIAVHESTVSRAVKGKYLQCAVGTYPLSYFFARRLGSEVSGANLSPDTAKALLKNLIAEEDKRRPLSDQKLCEQMAARGCVLSRRTVAKYRDELNIPSTTGRKQYE